MSIIQEIEAVAEQGYDMWSTVSTVKVSRWKFIKLLFEVVFKNHTIPVCTKVGIVKVEVR